MAPTPKPTALYPALESAHDLTPMQLNSIRFTDRHTTLTPELLASMRSTSAREPEQDKPS